MLFSETKNEQLIITLLLSLIKALPKLHTLIGKFKASKSVSKPMIKEGAFRDLWSPNLRMLKIIIGKFKLKRKLNKAYSDWSVKKNEFSHVIY